jgi:amidase
LKKIKKEDCIYTMSKDHKPALKVHSGDTVIFETYDCYNDQIKSENQPFSTIKRELNNPATGPLYIDEAESGDILKIEIIDIKINSHGVMTLRPDSGVLGEFFYETKSKIIPIEKDKVIFNDKIQIPVNPMIGVIGVAPYDGEIKTTIPDSHGGNLDCKRIRKGSIVYLQVHTKGALLSIGDLHAVMADGEVVICGLEVSGETIVKVDVIKGKALPLPMVVEGDHIMTISSKKTLDEAAKTATIHMHKFLINELNMDAYEAGTLLSLVGDLRICQVVDPLMTARMELPKYILDKYNYKMV